MLIISQLKLFPAPLCVFLHLVLKVFFVDQAYLGAVIGSIAGLIIPFVVLIVRVCCILRRRQATASRVEIT